jgi:hypothetical protein
MAKIYTFDLPDYDDYNVVSELLPDGRNIAHQYYYKNGVLISQADIYYDMKDGEPFKWPHLMVFKDISGEVVVTESTE